MAYEVVFESVKDWSRQKAFDVAVKHLAKQGEKCESGGDCLYRGPEGMACAVGALIPDSRYKESMESLSARDMDVMDAVCPGLRGESEFLVDLQVDLHDSDDIEEIGSEDWWEQVEAFAAKGGLEVPSRE